MCGLHIKQHLYYTENVIFAYVLCLKMLCYCCVTREILISIRVKFGGFFFSQNHSFVYYDAKNTEKCLTKAQADVL